jgi:ribosomal-protein-alanine N-acetyltransferase
VTDPASASSASASASGGGVLLRTMRWWDVEAILPLERDLFGPSGWSAETFWSELAHPQTRWYVVAVPADEPDRVIGYAGLLAPGGEADVQTIAVAASAQGRGVGGILIDALITNAQARSATALLLEVRADNQPAIRLYTKRGFERIAVRRRYYQPDDVDAWVMRLGLVGDPQATP